MYPDSDWYMYILHTNAYVIIYSVTGIISTLSFTAMNLMLCYYAVSDRDKLKKCFHRMLQISTGISDEDRYYPAVVRYVPPRVHRS